MRKFHSKILESVSERLLKITLKLQDAFATFMNRKINQLGARGIRVFAILIIMLGSGFSFYVALKGFRTTSRDGPPPSITIPVHANPVDPLQELTLPVITGSHLDSLLAHSDSLHGTTIWDSIMKERPGLADSIRVLQLYRTK